MHSPPQSPPSPSSAPHSSSSPAFDLAGLGLLAEDDADLVFFDCFLEASLSSPQSSLLASAESPQSYQSMDGDFD